jgi:5-methylthioadenosine/S-adenosylhomocysteine deaminase
MPPQLLGSALAQDNWQTLAMTTEVPMAEEVTPQPAHLAIVGGTVLPSDGSDPVVADVIVHDGRVVEIAEPGRPIDAGRTIDAAGSAVLPGFVDSHTHIASNMLLRGFLEDTELFAWLDTMWRLKQNFDHETLYWASMCGLVEMAKSGITCFNEHFDAYAVTPQARALQDIHLRATLGYGFADGGVYADVADWSWAALADFDAATAGADGIDGDRVRLALSPHAPYSCSEAMWREVRALADDRKLPIHTHVAEGLNETAYMQETYGKTTVQWLHDIGFLASDITAAHCTQLTASDITLLAEHDVKVAHCPVCNAKLVSGTMDLRGLMAAGVTVGLATDGPASHNTLDTFQEMKYAAITHKQATGDPTFLTTREVLDMATRESAKAMHRPELGTISVGAPADITIVDMSGAHVAPLYDIEAALVYGSRADDVTHTIVGGQLVFDAGEVVGVDEEQVVARFTEHALALRDRSI